MSLTIKLDDPIPDTLQKCAITLFLDPMTFPFGFAKIGLEHYVQRRRHDREDNGPTA